MKNDNPIPTKTILSIGLLLGGLLIGKKILEKIGVLKTAAEEKAQRDVDQAVSGSETQLDPSGNIPKNPNPGLALNVRYWLVIVTNLIKQKKIPDQKTWSKETYNKYFNPYGTISTVSYVTVLTSLAKQIFDAKGIFNDDEDKIYGAFQACKNQAQISIMSGFFLNNYKRDLWTYLQSFLDTEQQAKIYNIIKGKPLL